MPTYNRAHLVSQAIQSVLDQSHRYFVLLVVDDASRDNTGQVVHAFSDPRLSYIRHERNRGAPAARNTGIEMSSGEYIAFLDDDDTWHPEKLEHQLTVFEAAPREVGVVCCHYRGASTVGCIDHICTASGDVLRRALEFDLIGCITSTMLVKAHALHGVYPLDESLPGCQDSDLTIMLATDWHFSFADEVLVFKGQSHQRILTSPAKHIGRKMVIDKHEGLYQRFTHAVKRRALARHQYELGRGKITRSRDYSAGLAALLKSTVLSPSLVCQMLLRYVRHQHRTRTQTARLTAPCGAQGFPDSPSDASQQ